MAIEQSHGQARSVLPRSSDLSRVPTGRPRRHAGRPSVAELNLGGLTPLDRAIPGLEDWARIGPQTSGTSGGIGRRTGFRFRHRKVWEFDPPLVHHGRIRGLFVPTALRVL